MKTTKKQFEEFKKWVYFYQEKFGLQEYKIYVKWKKLEDRYACNNYGVLGRVSAICFSTELSEEDFEYCNPQEHAKHEVIHLLLAELFGFSGERYVSKEHLETCEEGIVRKLEKLL